MYTRVCWVRIGIMCLTVCGQFSRPVGFDLEGLFRRCVCDQLACQGVKLIIVYNYDKL